MSKVYYPPASSTLYIPFASYGKTNAESITLSGSPTFSVNDIRIYKNGNTPQRSSKAGYAVLGIDFDGLVGIHGISIDLSNDTDVGFYAVGSWYWVMATMLMVDGQIVNAILGEFRIMEQENPSGVPDVNVTHWNGSEVATPSQAGVPEVDVTHNAGTAITAASGRQEVNVSHAGGSAVSQSGGLLNANVTQISDDATAADNLEKMLDGTGGVTLSAIIGGTVTGIEGVTFPTNFAVMSIDGGGLVNVDIESINGVPVVGNGTSTKFAV